MGFAVLVCVEIVDAHRSVLPVLDDYADRLDIK
jgi:hypothetical protein